MFVIFQFNSFCLLSIVLFSVLYFYCSPTFPSVREGPKFHVYVAISLLTVLRDGEDGPATLAKPTSKACIKRVKFIVNNCRRYLRKLKVRIFTEVIAASVIAFHFNES